MKVGLHRLDMYKRVNGEFIKCTIEHVYIDAFTTLGFVDHVDKLPKPRKKKVKQHGGNNERRLDTGSISVN